MREALEALNRLVSTGKVTQYAIGGAIAAAFYIEAVQTEALDAFVFLPPSTSGLALLTPIYSELVALGGVVEHEHVRFGQWPLQILTDANDLIADAIREALDVTFEDVPTRVFRPEHLCAIALQTGRTKALLRVTFFLEQSKVDRKTLQRLIERFGLHRTALKLPAELWKGETHRN